MDRYGNITPDTKRGVAKLIIERFMNLLPVEQGRAIAPGTKWQAVDLLAAGKGEEARALLVCV